MSTKLYTISSLILISITYSQKYILQSVLLNFDDAEAKCMFEYNTHLASIHDASDTADALSTALNNGVWHGLRDDITENTWYNIDSTPWDYGTDISGGVDPWADDPALEPNNAGDEDCAEMREIDGKWNDIPCSELLYSLCNSPQTDYLFNDPSWYSRIPSPNNIIGVIDILDEIHIEFDLVAHSWPIGPNNFTSILRLGNDNSERYPEIALHSSQTIYTSFGRIDNNNPFFNGPGGGSLETLYHVVFNHTQDHRAMSVEGNLILDEDVATHPILFNRNIYFGDNIYPAADATITNLIITSSNTHGIDGFDYDCDSVNRFSIVSGDWDIEDPNVATSNNFCWGQRQNDDTVEGAIIWLGDNDPTSLDWTDLSVEVEVKIITANSAGQAGLIVRANNICATNDCGQQYWIGIEYNVQKVTLGLMNDGWSPIAAVDASIVLNEFYTLRVDLVGSSIKIYYDDVLLISETRTEYPSGSIGLRTWQSKSKFKNMRIVFPSNNQLYTVEPTTSPTKSPTFPTMIPTNIPTKMPTDLPSKIPTTVPSKPPTNIPSQSPTNQPSTTPSSQPSGGPTEEPTKDPSQLPTINPTKYPTIEPTTDPTKDPTQFPTTDPSQIPTIDPTYMPTTDPTKRPSNSPTRVPTQSPQDQGGVDESTTSPPEGPENSNTSSNGGLNDDSSISSILEDNMLYLIAGLVLICILTCCCWICVYWKANKKKELDDKDNIELGITVNDNGEGMSNATMQSNGAIQTKATGFSRIASISSIHSGLNDSATATLVADTPAVGPPLLTNASTDSTQQQSQRSSPYTNPGLITPQMPVNVMPNIGLMPNMLMPNMMMHNLMAPQMPINVADMQTQSNLNIAAPLPDDEDSDDDGIGPFGQGNDDALYGHRNDVTAGNTAGNTADNTAIGDIGGDNDGNEYEYYDDEEEEEEENALYGRGNGNGNNNLSPGGPGP